MVKGWRGFVGGSRFKSRWGQKFKTPCNTAIDCKASLMPIYEHTHVQAFKEVPLSPQVPTHIEALPYFFSFFFFFLCGIQNRKNCKRNVQT